MSADDRYVQHCRPGMNAKARAQLGILAFQEHGAGVASRDNGSRD